MGCRPRRLSHVVPAYAAAVVVLVLLLGTGAQAATGGTFLLGRSNTAGGTSAVSSDGSAVTLRATNTGGGSAAAFAVRPGVAPFRVSSPVTVPRLSADRLDGLDSSAFEQVRTGRLSLDADGATQRQLLALPGYGALTVACSASPQQAELRLAPGGSGRLDVVTQRTVTSPDGLSSGVTATTLAGGGALLGVAAGAPAAGRFVVQLARSGAAVTTVTVSLTDDGDSCLALAQAL